MPQTAPDHAAPRLFGLLATFRRPDKLTGTLQRLAEQDRPFDRLLLLDNAPDDGNRRALDRLTGRGLAAEYVALPENLGAAGALAVGMRRVLGFAADDDWVVVLDDDDPPGAPTIIGELYRFAQAMTAKDERTGAIGLVGARFDWKRGRLVRPPDEELVGPVSVDCLGDNQFPFYRVGAIRTVGTYLEDLFMSHELEFGLRLRAAGFSMYAHGPLWREQRSIYGRLGMHVEPRKSIEEPTWRRYYNRRNFIYVLRTWDRDALALRIMLVRWLAKPILGLAVHPRWALSHLSLSLRAFGDGWRGRLGKRLEPTLDPETGTYGSRKEAGAWVA